MLELEDVSASYGAIRALRGVSLHVGEGEAVAIVGANGAGKTTLMRVISGLLPAGGGRVRLGSMEIQDRPPYEIAAMGVAHVPEGRRVFPTLTVEENLEMGSFTPAARKHRRETMEWVYSLFPRLKERRRQVAGTLSGGEQQMLAVARGLMLRPRLLLLDEPSSGLAPIVVDQMYRSLKEIFQQSRISVLVVEQNVRKALGLASRGYVLENGEIVLAGTSAELLGNPHVQQAYLGI